MSSDMMELFVFGFAFCNGFVLLVLSETSACPELSLPLGVLRQ